MRAFLFFLITFLGGLAYADYFSSTPRWVESVEIPKRNPSLGAESHYLLYNTQVCIADGELFHQYVYYVPNQSSAAHDSKIEISFNPEYETVAMHELRVLRDGAWIDKAKSCHIQLLQRELGLESHIINGYQTLVALIEDVREGDVVSYSYSIQGQHPAYRGHFFYSHGFGWGCPISRNYLRLIIPEGRSIVAKEFGGGPWLSEKSHNEWIFDIKDIDQIEHEVDVPYWYDLYPFVQFSDFASWQEVGKLFTPFYELSEVGSEVQECAADVTQESRFIEDKILRLVRFVQSEVRYLGLEGGMNAFRPTSPDRVLIQRHGDCKDKVLLLRALLEQIGVQSTPVLVNTTGGKTLDKRLPNAGAFNHVILQIHFGGRDYFVDPSLTYQGGSLKSLFIPPYFYGLSLGGEVLGLIDVPMNKLSHDEISAHSILKMECQKEVEIETTISYSGDEADYVREIIECEGKSSLLERISSYFSQLHGDVVDAQIEVDDRLEKNHLRVKSYLKLNRFEEEDPVPLQPIFLISYLTQNVDVKRHCPLGQPHPKNLHEKVTLQAPIRFERVNKKKSFEHSWGNLDFSMVSHGKDFSVEYQYSSNTDHILPQDLMDFRSHIRSTSKEVLQEMHLPQFDRPMPVIYLPGIGYAFLSVALGIILFTLIHYYKKVKQKKKAWLQKLSLIKKR